MFLTNLLAGTLGLFWALVSIFYILFQLAFSYIAYSYYFGLWPAIFIVGFCLLLRFTLPLAIGLFLGLIVYGLEWYIALIISFPSILFLFPSSLSLIYSIISNKFNSSEEEVLNNDFYKNDFKNEDDISGSRLSRKNFTETKDIQEVYTKAKPPQFSSLTETKDIQEVYTKAKPPQFSSAIQNTTLRKKVTKPNRFKEGDLITSWYDLTTGNAFKNENEKKRKGVGEVLGIIKNKEKVGDRSVNIDYYEIKFGKKIVHIKVSQQKFYKLKKFKN